MADATPDRDVVYAPGKGLSADIHFPLQPNGAAIVDIHGGGFFQGDKHKDADIAQAFAEAGYLVAVPNYRLAPAHLFPAAVDDVLEFVDWFKSSAHEFDRSRLGVFGSSAGGNLAIELGLRLGLPIVSWSGIIEMDDWLDAHGQVTPHRNDLSEHAASSTIDQSGADDPFYKWFLLNYFGGEDAAARQRARDASVLHRVTDHAGPMLLVNSLDEFVPRAGIMRLQQALAERGRTSIAQFIAGGRHAKGYQDDAMPVTLAFLRQALAAAT